MGRRRRAGKPSKKSFKRQAMPHRLNMPRRNQRGGIIL